MVQIQSWVSKWDRKGIPRCWRNKGLDDRSLFLVWEDQPRSRILHPISWWRSSKGTCWFSETIVDERKWQHWSGCWRACGLGVWDWSGGWFWWTSRSSIQKGQPILGQDPDDWIIEEGFVLRSVTSNNKLRDSSGLRGMSMTCSRLTIGVNYCNPGEFTSIPSSQEIRKFESVGNTGLVLKVKMSSIHCHPLALVGEILLYEILRWSHVKRQYVDGTWLSCLPSMRLSLPFW